MFCTEESWNDETSCGRRAESPESGPRSATRRTYPPLASIDADAHIDRETLRSILSDYAARVDDARRRTVHAELDALGLSEERVPQPLAGQLVQALGARLSDERSRREFMNHAWALLGRGLRVAMP